MSQPQVSDFLAYSVYNLHQVVVHLVDTHVYSIFSKTWISPLRKYDKFWYPRFVSVNIINRQSIYICWGMKDKTQSWMNEHMHTSFFKKGLTPTAGTKLTQTVTMKTVQRFSRAGTRGRVREWATLGVHPLSWLLSNNRLEEVCGTLTKGILSSRLFLSNQDKGCTPSVARSLPPGFCSTCQVCFCVCCGTWVSF